MVWIPEAPVRTPPFARHGESRERSCPGSSMGRTSSKHESQHTADSTGLPGSAQQSWARHSEQGSTVHPATPPVSRHGASQTTTKTRPKSPSSKDRSEEKRTITVSQSASSEVPASSQGRALSAVPATSSDPTDAGLARQGMPYKQGWRITSVPSQQWMPSGQGLLSRTSLSWQGMPYQQGMLNRPVPSQQWPNWQWMTSHHSLSTQQAWTRMKFQLPMFRPIPGLRCFSLFPKHPTKQIYWTY